METITTTTRDGKIVPAQEFNGKLYRLYSGERYFSRHNKRLHRVVWEYYNGPIPPGYDVHHKDHNPANNEIGNLELVEQKKHQSQHSRESVSKDRGAFVERMLYAGQFAKEWHKSPEGRAWHSKHAKEQPPRERVEMVCDCCGKTYVAARNGAKHHFCGPNCAAKFRRDSGLDNVTRVCEWCGKEYVTNRYSRQRFCSQSCGAAHHGVVLKARRNGGGV